MTERPSSAAFAPAAPETIVSGRDGPFPNSPYPALVYRRVIGTQSGPAAFEDLFAANGWTGSWRNGIYGFDHFHTTAHEVLGIAAGEVNALLGGPNGRSVKLQAGDVVVLPAGMSHRNLGSSSDLLVVGAYAGGRTADLRRGTEEDVDAAALAASRVPLPDGDPVTGPGGALVQLWTAVPEAPPGVP
jgi:uncharacterized protein YjlB